MKTKTKGHNKAHTILIVEDSPTQALQVRRILEDEGFTTAVCRNGKEALSYLKESKPTIIISDIVMPEMDGYELCNTIKKDETLKDIPVILLTALTSSEDVIKGLQAGADNFITKPYDKRFLLSRIQYILVNQEVRKKGTTEVGLNIYFMGQTHAITSNRMQIVDLLLSTYEHAVLQNQELKKTKAKLETLNKQLEEKVKQRTQRIERLNSLLRAIRGVNQLIIREKNPDRLIQEACAKLTSAREYHNAWIALMDESGELVTTAEAGLGKEFLPLQRLLKTGKLVHCAQRSLKKSGVVFIEDPSTACADCPLAKESHARGAMAVRLEHGGRTFGVLSISIPKELVGDKEELSLFEEAAGDISFGLHSIEMEEKRKRGEEALLESENKYRTLLENLPQKIFQKDRDSVYVSCNQNFAQDLKIKPEEIKGKTDFEFFPKELAEKYREDDKRIVESGKIEDIEEKYVVDAQEVWVWTIKTPVKNEKGNIIGILGIFWDITAQKKLEAQLQQAQRMEAIGTLAGGIAHDFNNILSLILGYTELSMHDVPEGSRVRDNLDKLLKAGERARDLVKQILTFSRQSEAKEKPIQIHLIVKEALKLLRPTLPATIEIRQHIATTGMVLADPTQIHQVLMNLCTNAYHAMSKKGGVLEVSLQEIDLDPEFTARHLDTYPGPYLKLTVSDTGHGMDRRTIDRIFDPYYTTKKDIGGTGMGLAVVHGIVKSHGGIITVYSEPGKGATFNVFLPRIEGPEAGEETEVVEALPRGNERILLVDDEPAIVDIGKGMLEHLGYKVETRTSSIEALEAFRAQPEKFDLVITDMTMPKMTGDKLARELMRIKHDIPIILCTGFSERINEDKAKTMGIRKFIMKPVVMSQMAKAVREALDK